ncbi:MAG TPA: hypothetical protein VMJ64_00975 [Anaerolineales bacterium]|nr:hypothetical protein [Anaerolineales bacterium]
MSSQIDDLVRMNDIQTLFELMTEDDDWMNQLDAAEGLVKLGDVRGLDFLRSAQYSEEDDIRKVAKEILASPVVEAKRSVLEADVERERKLKRQEAVKRLQAGRKVFQYKMIFLPATEILDEDPLSEGFDVPALTEYGLEGWEVVNMLPRRRQTLVNVVDDNMSGAYFLLKRELAAGDAKELDGS